MTINEKRARLEAYCGSTDCDECKLRKERWSNVLNSLLGCLRISESPEEDLNRALLIIDTQESDSVNHPSHYTDGKIEVIDFIEDKKLGFCLGNAVKYISRAGKKDPTKTVEDLNKAIWYIERRIKELEEGL